MFDGELFGQQMVEIVRGHLEAELAPLRADNETMRARIAELEAAARAMPEKGDPGEPGPPGQPGSVDMDVLRNLVDEAVAALPPPPAGKDGDPGEPGRDGAPGTDGKDGVGVADALIDRNNALVLTLTDGRTKSLGVVVGKDGEPGRDGEDGRHGEAFTLDDFDIEQYDDGRTLKFCFTRGDTMHSFEFAFPVVIDRGVFSVGTAYEKGDAVTWAGSLWIAQKDTEAKPDTADSGWRLAVKRGRDGKDAK